MFVRFESNNKESYGVLEGESIKAINGDIFESDYSVSDETYYVNEVTLLAPCRPSKIVCVGLNYKDHAEEVSLPLPEQPLLFLKPNTTLIGPNDVVKYPKQSEQIDYEGELAIVIGEKAKDVKPTEANNYILGFTCANDVTARDIQFGDGQWTRGKSFDTFLPLGPGIVENVNLEDSNIQLTVNGEVKQKSNLNQLIFKVDELVSYISEIMTLLPGDVIITGTPHGVGPVNSGDVMKVSIDGIGELENKILD
ncbi:fumarylacetoacetate hydrolase family protein [Halobacillus amylolyticus]|uniref:Fumarylacetoacetate hydrolase family protein n=1 Tax=Halobacillus amylolyticus TaxID=2932259 RepID=A0ABY4HD69_9BACI|nr:fumarylacetoacetate hydrolase family protein [Halobacillus amylolyticus]UOR11360.1 fumarylacetoacetate hydrolase family protein [Halobacillus amylolyticus]